MRRVKGMNEVRREGVFLFHHVGSAKISTFRNATYFMFLKMLPKRIHAEVLIYVFIVAFGIHAVFVDFFHVRLHDRQTKWSDPLNVLPPYLRNKASTLSKPVLKNNKYK